jgi:TIR domain-containing protein
LTELSRAVFLSYASQDAEAAQRICEALRAAGIEVWFDARIDVPRGLYAERVPSGWKDVY